MFLQQRELQIKAYGKDPATLQGEERIQFFKEMKLALQDELHEALNEMGWKPWAKSKHFNEEAVQGEIVDAWHFFMNLCLVANMSPELLWAKYMAKRQKNIERQLAGYTGVDEKCPVCKRALDDDAVECVKNGPNVWCDFDKKWYRIDGPSLPYFDGGK